MLEYMENISQSEAENIRKTIQDLSLIHISEPTRH